MCLDLTSYGYQSYRAFYETTFGMYFATVKDPDGTTVLLSGDANTLTGNVKLSL